jgi:hypothetical protein
VTRTISALARRCQVSLAACAPLISQALLLSGNLQTDLHLLLCFLNRVHALQAHRISTRGAGGRGAIAGV